MQAVSTCAYISIKANSVMANGDYANEDCRYIY